MSAFPKKDDYEPEVWEENPSAEGENTYKNDLDYFLQLIELAQWEDIIVAIYYEPELIEDESVRKALQTALNENEVEKEIKDIFDEILNKKEIKDIRDLIRKGIIYVDTSGSMSSFDYDIYHKVIDSFYYRREMKLQELIDKYREFKKQEGILPELETRYRFLKNQEKDLNNQLHEKLEEK